jgi:hypothetical protein
MVFGTILTVAFTFIGAVSTVTVHFFLVTPSAAMTTYVTGELKLFGI